jgi:hypothetical protein
MELNDTGVKLLLAGIVEQAVQDLKTLQRRGKIIGGQIVGKIPAQSELDPRQLLYFFSDEGPLQSFFQAMNLDTEISAVRKQLNLE